MLEEEGLLETLLKEPEGYHKPPPEDKYEFYQRETENGTTTLTVRLVGYNPLWGHYLWNAARCLAKLLDKYPELLCRDKLVLELGAGAALPSLITVANQAKRVVITDYPDQDLLDNIIYNSKTLYPEAFSAGRIIVQGYLWGKPVESLLELIKDDNDTGPKFDLLILCDLIFNHSEHERLLRTCEKTLSRQGVMLVYFSHHRPSKSLKDLAFFDLAQKYGFHAQRIEETLTKPMFEKDEGDENVRATVHGFQLRWSDQPFLDVFN